MDVLIGEYENRSKMSYDELKNLCLITSHKVDRLSEDLKSMGEVVKNLVNGIADKGVKTKTKGGQTSVCTYCYL